MVGDPPHAKARVLVAEDDTEMRRLVAEVLENDGYTVEQAADGREAISRLVPRDGEPGDAIDLVVSDVRMPGATGFDILEKLRAASRATPVILMTAFGDGDVSARARALGAALVFKKPFALTDLRSFIALLLERRAR